MESTKLGRCECRGIECHLWSPDKDDKGSHVAATRCQAAAVRMVIVAGKVTDSDGLTIAPVAYTEVPMCQACADFHEKGGAK